MKKYIFIVFAVIVYIDAYAQQRLPWNEENIDKFINKTEFIFEGEVIDTMYYNGATGGFDILQEMGKDKKPIYPLKPLTALKVQIHHIVRGNFNQGTVELVDYIGAYWANGVLMHNIVGDRQKPISPGTKGLFFCTKSPYKPSPMKTDNEVRLIPVEIVGFYMESWTDPKASNPDSVIAFGFDAFGKIFSSKKEFYKYLAKYPNITIPKENANNDKDSKSNQENRQDSIEKKDD